MTCTFDDRFRADLCGLGYPGFAHIAPYTVPPRPDSFLFEVLAQPDFDARVAEGLPWLVHHWADRMDLVWLVEQARQLHVENRVGYLLEASGSRLPAVLDAIRELRRLPSTHEVTLGWDSMPRAAREWMRINRTAMARRWNMVTRLENEAADRAA